LASPPPAPPVNPSSPDPGLSSAGAQPAPKAEVVARAEARSELSEYLDLQEQRRRLFPHAALVGAAAGLAAILFRVLLAGAEAARDALLAWSHRVPAVGWLAPALFCAVGAALAVFLVRRYAPETSGSGIPHIEAVLLRRREMRWRRVLPVKFFGGVAAIGAGLALGREGPTVQMGGAAAAAVADVTRVPARARATLIAAGAGAGLAAAFNAPLAGLVFVIEEMQRDFRAGVFGAAFIAAVVADLVQRLVAGQLPVFTIPVYPTPPLSAAPVFAVLGLLCGLLGVAFNRGLLSTLDVFQRFRGRKAYLAAAAVGGIIGLIAWIAPYAVGTGHGLTETTLQGHVPAGGVFAILALRFVLTLTSYGTGAPGGIFAPLLALGALLGLAVGLQGHALAPAAVPQPAAFAVVGMAGCFAAIVRAPLTGIVLIVEMTGNYDQMLPLLVTCFCAYAVAELVGELPVYEALLQRDLMRGEPDASLHGPMVLEFEIEQGAAFSGRRIRDLGLPAGCIIVRCRDGAREWVATAETRLDPHMRITAVVAPEAAPGIDILREGCEASLD
jgi:CIC family chloride channel protein